MSTESSKTRKYEKKARADAEQQTRARIAKVAAELHNEVGPAATTVAEIARRASVSRLTVYNHFPDNEALYPACSAHWVSEHPIPDFGPALSEEDPAERVRAVALLLYSGIFRAWGLMVRNLQRDRTVDPALDRFMAGGMDAVLGGLADQLAAGFGAQTAKEGRVRPMARLALDFWTWSRLDAEGLSDEEAAELMAASVAGAGG